MAGKYNIHLYDSLSDESKIIIDLIWPNGDYPKGSGLHKNAKRRGLDIDSYLLYRFNSPNPYGGTGRGSKKLSEERKRHLSDYWKGKKKSLEHTQRIREAKKGEKNPMYGIERSEEHLRKASVGIKEAKARIRESEEYKSRRADTRDKRAQRNLYDYATWRNEVYERDNYTCLKTGVRGGKLHAHHLWSFSVHDDLRFSVFNGVTLSEEAHKEFHKAYGNRNNTVWQFEEWLGRELPPEIRDEIIAQEQWDAYDNQQAIAEYDYD